MDGNELTLLVTGALLVAVLVGWVLHWIYARMNNPSGPRSIKQTARMAERLHDAEDAQHAAETRLATVEADLGQRIAEMQAELDAAHESLEAARDETETIRAAYRQATLGPGGVAERES